MHWNHTHHLRSADSLAQSTLIGKGKHCLAPGKDFAHFCDIGAEEARIKALGEGVYA